MAKHLVDLDEDLLQAARAELGEKTIKATVNEALRRVSTRTHRDMTKALRELALADLADRSDAWR